MKWSLFLFYLLILFLPSQLTRHFFFDFAQISGIRSDYLAPAVYFTDIIAVLVIISAIPNPKSVMLNLFQHPFKTLKRVQRDKRTTLFLFFIFYLLFNVLFVAANKWVALVKFIKIIELIFLGVAVSKIRPKLSTITAVLSVSVFYTSAIAVCQFLIQRTTGIFWFLGERTFYSATPGIAAFYLPSKGLLLRAYSTFPHPNVLGGFLAVVLTVILSYLIINRKGRKKTNQAWFVITLFLGLVALFLSFSRVAWAVAFLGFGAVYFQKEKQLFSILEKKKKAVIAGFYCLLVLSAVGPLVFPQTTFAKFQYWQERVVLVKTTMAMIAANPLFGVGLNNSIIQAQNYIKTFPGLYIFQPVHNIYLLVLAETGIVGLSFFLLFFLAVFKRLFKTLPLFLFILMQLFILGLFDHYLFTLQQGQLLFVVFTALSFIPKVAY